MLSLSLLAITEIENYALVIDVTTIFRKVLTNAVTHQTNIFAIMS